jgi:hypothetical protein
MSWFGILLSTIPNTVGLPSEVLDGLLSLRATIIDEHGRFQIWAGNIGALQPVKKTSSLEYRLRDAPKIANQVVEVLEDLEEALDDSR